MQVLLHPSDKPVFRLRGSSAQCCIEIRINHVPIHRHKSQTAHHFDIAINEWLFQGINTFDIWVGPVEKGAALPLGAHIEAKMTCKALNQPVSHAVEVGELDWKPEPPAPPGLHNHDPGHAPDSPPDEFDEPSALLALPGHFEDLQWTVRPPRKLPENAILIQATLPLPPPWWVCPWQHGDFVGSQIGSRIAILSMLRTLHASLRLGGWREQMKKRSQSIQTAYHLDTGQIDAVLGFPLLLDTPGWTLQPLPQESRLVLEQAASGRLARLVDSDTGDSPLVLTNEGLSLSATIEAWWMFDRQWAVIR